MCSCCSACTSASLEPSYVLRAIGTDEDLAHSSIRFVVYIYNISQNVNRAFVLLSAQHSRDQCFSQIWNWQIHHRGRSGLHSGEVHSARQAVEGDEVSYSLVLSLTWHPTSWECLILIFLEILIM